MCTPAIRQTARRAELQHGVSVLQRVVHTMRRIPRSRVVFYARYIDRLLTTLLLLYDLATLAGAIAPARTLCYYT